MKEYFSFRKILVQLPVIAIFSQSKLILFSNQMKQQESFFPAFLSYDLSSFIWLKECWLSNPHVETALFLSLCLFVSKATVWSQGNPNICRTYFMCVWAQLQQAISQGLSDYQQKHIAMQISWICLHGIKASSSCRGFNNTADVWT